jgi:hypothetical protein
LAGWKQWRVRQSLHRQPREGAETRAIDAKIEEQRAFVAWWGVAVRGDGRPKKNVPRTRDVSMREAEDLTGMANQRVADLRKRLGKPVAGKGSLTRFLRFAIVRDHLLPSLPWRARQARC